MGYTTDFSGKFNLDKPLEPQHAAYLRKFNETRRMRRADYDAAKLPDPAREAVRLPLGGPDAPYFVGGTGYAGQGKDQSVRDHNAPPEGQPGLWCKWRPTDDGTGIEWDGAEKFYDYAEWLQYLMDHFLKPWGYTLSGSVTWQGECGEDRGVLAIEDGTVEKRPTTDAAWDDDVSEDDRQWVLDTLKSLADDQQDDRKRAALLAAIDALSPAEQE